MQLDGYKSTVGVAEFHESKLNMPDARNKDNIVGNPGRRPKVILF